MPVPREQPPTEEDLAILEMKRVRSEDIRRIIERVEGLDVGELRRTRDIGYYPVRFFVDGVEAYRYMFDNASIYYSATAVELGLVLKLRDKIDQGASSKMPGFKWLIDNCGDLLDELGKQKAHRVRRIRNCYIHYQNIIGYNSHLEASWRQLARQLRQLKDATRDKELRRLLRMLLEDDTGDKAPMPIFRLGKVQLNQDIIQFIEERHSEYREWLGSVPPEKVRRLPDNKFADHYHIEVFDALTCLNWSFDLLKYLEFL